MIEVAGTFAAVASKRTIEESVPVVPDGIFVVVSVNVNVPAPVIVPVAFKPLIEPFAVTVRPEPMVKDFDASTVSAALTIGSLVATLVVPEIVKLLNVVAAAPVMFFVVPVMTTVPELCVKVPPLLKCPATVNVVALGAVSVPLEIVRSFPTEVAPDMVVEPPD
jgi:hypothetical protein